MQEIAFCPACVSWARSGDYDHTTHCNSVLRRAVQISISAETKHIMRCGNDVKQDLFDKKLEQLPFYYKSLLQTDRSLVAGSALCLSNSFKLVDITKRTLGKSPALSLVLLRKAQAQIISGKHWEARETLDKSLKYLETTQRIPCGFPFARGSSSLRTSTTDEIWPRLLIFEAKCVCLYLSGEVLALRDLVETIEALLLPYASHGVLAVIEMRANISMLGLITSFVSAIPEKAVKAIKMISQLPVHRRVFYLQAVGAVLNKFSKRHSNTAIDNVSSQFVAEAVKILKNTAPFEAGHMEGEMFARCATACRALLFLEVKEALKQCVGIRTKSEVESVLEYVSPHIIGRLKSTLSSGTPGPKGSAGEIESLLKIAQMMSHNPLRQVDVMSMSRGDSYTPPILVVLRGPYWVGPWEGIKSPTQSTIRTQCSITKPIAMDHPHTQRPCSMTGSRIEISNFEASLSRVSDVAGSLREAVTKSIGKKEKDPDALSMEDL